jgi:hypothetical protein
LQPPILRLINENDEEDESAETKDSRRSYLQGSPPC